MCYHYLVLLFWLVSFKKCRQLLIQYLFADRYYLCSLFVKTYSKGLRTKENLDSTAGMPLAKGGTAAGSPNVPTMLTMAYGDHAII